MTTLGAAWNFSPLVDRWRERDPLRSFEWMSKPSLLPPAQWSQPIPHFVEASQRQVARSRFLVEIEEAIRLSEEIFELRDNWDGEGAPGYTRDTWERAIKFVRTSAEMVDRRYGLSFRAPNINPGPDGSIDVHWRTDDGELLVNIPAEPGALAEFYGDDYGQAVIRGKLNPARSNHELILWLISSQR